MLQNTEQNAIRIGIIAQNVAKCNEIDGKLCVKGARSDKVGQGWIRLEKVRPGGMRDGRILRFAEAGTVSAFGLGF